MGGDMAAPELWQGMLDLYSAPGVPDASVNLQDACDADVLLILTAVLLAQNGLSLTPALADRLFAETRVWRREVVVPLRSLRRRWRGRSGAEALRERVKSLELDAERSQVGMLQSVLDAESPLSAATAGLELLHSNCRVALYGGRGCPACDAAQAAFCDSVAAWLWPETRPQSPSANPAENPGVAE
ncbi:MAG: TIGR02444 family protein [Chromatocurvus sp.]